MWSIESTCLIRIIGVEDLVVDFKGNGRLNPQSPLPREDCGVSIEACVGYGRVAVSESWRYPPGPPTLFSVAGLVSG